MGFMDKIKNMIGIEDEYYDDEYTDEYYDQYEDSVQDTDTVRESEPVSTSTEEAPSSYRESSRNTRSSNIVNVSNSSSSSNKMKICIQEPLTYDDGPSVIDNITANRTVVLNLEMLEVDKKRQIFDFVSGGVYALNGNIQKVTKDIYVIVPKGVEVDGSISEAVSQHSLYQL